MAVTLLLVGACTIYQPVAGGSSQVELSGPFHRVQRGETLSRIAARYGVSWRQIAAANDIGRPYTIYTGQALRLPDARTPAPEAAPARAILVAAQEPVSPRRQRAEPVRATPAPEPVVTTTAAPVVGDGVYMVRSGDTLYSIAGRVGLPLKELAALNDIRPPYRLLAGQKLNVPSTVATPTPKPATALALSGQGFLWPVSGKIVARFGQSTDGLRRDGINIAARRGTPVRAAEDGVVVYADQGIRGYGRMILLRHAEDYITTYAHNAALMVDVGDLVHRGQIIARVGDTGSVKQAQLHFEIRKGLEPLDPEDLLVQATTEIASFQ